MKIYACDLCRVRGRRWNFRRNGSRLFCRNENQCRMRAAWRQP